MVVFPNAKINLGLNVIRKRTDGFHDLETVFYPINLREVLEVLPIKGNVSSFKSTGLTIPSDQKKNIVLQAYQILAQDFDLPCFDFRLHKLIPIGAGLGGGSSDAAFTIRAINEYCKLGLSVTQMEGYAGKLGSDCPFFISNQVVYATGKGEVFKAIDFSLKGKFLLMVNPLIHVSTSKAYAGIIAQDKGRNIPAILAKKVEDWKGLLCNDFELNVFKQHPQLIKIKELLYKNGAFYASMSGSGSTMYGLFDEKPNLSDFSEHVHWTLTLD